MIKEEIILKLKDGYITNIETDKKYKAGCETCDYGSEYIDKVNIILSKYYIDVNINNEYFYGISEGFLIKLFINNTKKIEEMKEKEFINWFKIQIDDEIPVNAEMTFTLYERNVE